MPRSAEGLPVVAPLTKVARLEVPGRLSFNLAREIVASKAGIKGVASKLGENIALLDKRHWFLRHGQVSVIRLGGEPDEQFRVSRSALNWWGRRKIEWSFLPGILDLIPRTPGFQHPCPFMTADGQEFGHLAFWVETPGGPRMMRVKYRLGDTPEYELGLVPGVEDDFSWNAGTQFVVET